MSSKDPYLILASDTHLSSPDGRWHECTAHFLSFMDSLKADPPEIIFINGDIVDNITLDGDGRPVEGTPQNWAKDVREYRALRARYDAIQFHGSLGPGHDTSEGISMERAAEALCPARGSFLWQGFDFVWLSGKVHSFSNDCALREESFYEDDLAWLDAELAKHDRVVLLFHVPLTTEETAKRGSWRGNRSIVTPVEDKIYGVIDRHLDSIEMIFNGHIHGVIESDYKGIPLKIGTFYNQGHHFRVSVHDEELDVSVHTYPSVDQKV